MEDSNIDISCRPFLKKVYELLGGMMLNGFETHPKSC